MQKQIIYEIDKKQKFTNEEITIFKRYIEENNICNENNFEYIEENLNYYSSRYSNENYISPFELFQANSNFINSDEIIKNIKLYNTSIEWYNETVHPSDSEYVVKEEKYIYIQELDDILKNLIQKLNQYDKSDYQCMDILIYYKEKIYQYLSQKDFVFTWKKNGKKIFEKLLNEKYYQFINNLDKINSKDVLIILPIYVPIRQALFVGEFGFRNSIIKYGRIIERIINYLDEKYTYDNIEKFENSNINNILGLDGIEKSIYNILFFKIRGEEI